METGPRILPCFPSAGCPGYMPLLFLRQPWHSPLCHKSAFLNTSLSRFCCLVSLLSTTSYKDRNVAPFRGFSPCSPSHPCPLLSCCIFWALTSNCSQKDHIPSCPSGRRISLYFPPFETTRDLWLLSLGNQEVNHGSFKDVSLVDKLYIVSKV